MGGAPVGLKKRHQAGSLQTEVVAVEVGDRGMEKPNAGERRAGGVRRGGSLSSYMGNTYSAYSD